MYFEPGFGSFSFWPTLGPLNSEYIIKGSISYWTGRRDSVLVPHPTPSKPPFPYQVLPPKGMP